MLRLNFSAILASAAALALSILIATGVQADPTDVVTVVPAPEGQGDSFVPGVRLVADLEEDYVEEEYLVSGWADLYNYANNPPLGPTDIVKVANDMPYQTRMIVRRPADDSDFNGTVVIEWWNSTAGFDSAPTWDTSAEYFAREGIVYVGVTNSTTSLGFLVGGCALFGVLPPTCGTRYATLSLPENGLAYEMMSQIATLMKSDSERNPLPEGFDVERLYHAGQSQQGGSIITYASAFHIEGNDGYFVQQASSARTINSGPSCESSTSPPFPDCTPRLQGDDNLVRSDLPVPVVHAITETDIDVLFGIAGRQPDTPTFRYYEIAGGSHLTVHKNVEVLPAGLVGPDPIFLEDLCLFPINSTADGPVFVSYVLNALWENLEEQVRRDRDPPPGVIMETDVLGAVNRDANGNGLGGVRLPSMDVPIATYTPGNVANPFLPPFLQGIGNLACRLASSVSDFDQATLDALYPTNQDYVNKVIESSKQLQEQGFLLEEDAVTIVVAAATSGIGACGLGFELVFLLPPILWLRRRALRLA